MTIKREIEIDLPDDVANRVIAWRKPRAGDTAVLGGGELCEAKHEWACCCLILAPKREPLVTRIARAVIAGECGFTPAMERLEENGSGCWGVRWIGGRFTGGSREYCLDIPPHEPGDPETVLVSDINAEVERLRLEDCRSTQAKGGGA